MDKQKIKEQFKNGTVGKFLIWLLEGVIIGGGAILPGVSGGVLAVTFGLYQPMMATLSHPKANLKKYWKMFLPIIIGWVLGFFVFSKGISAFFSADSTIAVSLFAGLVAGSLPQLFLDAEKEGSRRRDWVGFTLVLIAAVIGVMGASGEGAALSLTPNVFWYLLCGAMWGLSLVVPGMTSSSILIWLGLFQPLMDGVSALDFSVLIPFAVGIVGTVLLTAKLVNAFFNRYYGLASRIIVAFVIASTLAIIPTSFKGVGEALLCILIFAAGFAGAWAMDRFGKVPDKD